MIAGIGDATGLVLPGSTSATLSQAAKAKVVDLVPIAVCMILHENRVLRNINTYRACSPAVFVPFRLVSDAPALLGIGARASLG